MDMGLCGVALNQKGGCHKKQKNLPPRRQPAICEQTLYRSDSTPPANAEL